MTLKAEIYSQPVVLRNLLAGQTQAVAVIANALGGRDFEYVYLAARGTSDNAARYASYLLGALNGIPVALAAPSLFTRYEQPPSLKGALVIGVSQSGQSPDIVSVVAEGRRQGRPTLAITNVPASPLGQAAEFVIDLQAGEEKAVAATKTYTSQLTALAMLAVALRGEAELSIALNAIPESMQRALEADEAAEKIANRLRGMQRCVVLGRGYQYATAFEWSLKLKELTYVLAEPYSPADFQHGPVAMIEPGFAVMAVATAGKVFDGTLALLQGLKEKLAADVVPITDRAEAFEWAPNCMLLPAGVPEWLAPIISIVPGQLLAYHLTVAKGYDPDRPRSIQKVTETE